MGEPVDDEVRAHVAGCAKCGEAMKGLEPEETLPPLRVVPLRRRVWPRVVAGLSLAAAASVLLMVRPSPTRIKGDGGPLLGMYVQHDGQVRRVWPGETVAAGDAVRFAVTTPVPGYVAVLSRDPRGRASVYFPSAEVAASKDVALPTATRLDGSVGEEEIVGVFCALQLDVEPLRAALEKGSLSAPDGCEVTRWSFVKR